MLGRPLCVELPAGQVAIVLEDHIHGKVSHRLPYSTYSMRKRARWPEIYKSRSCLADVLTATAGFQLKNTYANEEMQTAVDSTETEGSKDEVEKCAYRLRTMMSHLRDAKKNSWMPPRKFDAVRGLISLVQVGNPPMHRTSKQKAMAKLKRQAEKQAPAKGKKPERQLKRNTSSTSEQSSAGSSSVQPPSPLGALRKVQPDTADESDGVEEVPVVKVAPQRIDLELNITLSSRTFLPNLSLASWLPTRRSKRG